MMMKIIKVISLILTLIIFFSGCAGFKHGYNKSRAFNQYLKVNEISDNFGYQRVQQIMGFRKDAVKNFIEEKGLPNFIYEYEKDGREGFVFYYIQEGKAYDFLEQNWRPDSANLIDIREFTDFEKERFGI
jgi:hypothetical protein